MPKDITLDEIMGDLARSLQDAPRRDITEDAAIAALAVVYGRKPRTADALLRFLAAANVLNAYVKQPGHTLRIGYGFKDELVPLAHAVAAGRYEGALTWSKVDETGLPVTFFQVGEIQFSFHRLPLGCGFPEGPGARPIAFDGVRKQCCAAELFAAVSVMAAA